MSMREDRLDLSMMELGPEQMDRLTAKIMARVEPEMRRRRASRGVLGLVTRWRGPVVAASALITVASLVAILMSGSVVEVAPALTADIYDAIEIQQPVRQWLAEERGPTMAELVTVVEEGYAP